LRVFVQENNLVGYMRYNILIDKQYIVFNKPLSTKDVYKTYANYSL